MKSWIEFFNNAQIVKAIKIMMFAQSAEAAGYGQVHEKDLKKVIAPAIKIALWAFAVGFGFFFVWGGLAPLDQANMAEAVVVVAGNRKTIQHQEGGIIQEIKVTDGQLVAVGDPLIILNDRDDRATAHVLKSRLMIALAAQERLIAEQDNLDSISWDPNAYDHNDPEIKQILKTQTNLFETGKRAYRGQIEILNEQIGQSEQKIVSLKSQLSSYQTQLKLSKDELSGVKELYTQGLALKPRLFELERHYSEVQSMLVNIQSQIITAQQDISTKKISILNVENEYQKNIAAELKQNHGTLLEVDEQYQSFLEKLQRKVIKAPVSGVVTDIKVHTIGGVIQPGAKIMDIVPGDQKLILEAKVKTQDIDGIRPGMDVKVQLAAFKSKIVPRLSAKVLYIAADMVTDQYVQNAYPHYIARIEIDEEELASLTADVKLYPGMPAQVFIIKGTRTFLRYLMDPITDSFYRAFKEK